ncbi:MAG: hypothetical protein KBG68_00455 [Prevotella sp.]|nr:hypothetical protein [Prevotella sp.]
MKKKKDSFFKDLKRYFETTPQEVLDKDFEEIMSENQEGPDMLDILPTREQVKQYRRQMKQYKNK